MVNHHLPGRNAVGGKKKKKQILNCHDQRLRLGNSNPRILTAELTAVPSSKCNVISAQLTQRLLTVVGLNKVGGLKRTSQAKKKGLCVFNTMRWADDLNLLNDHIFPSTDFSPPSWRRDVSRRQHQTSSGSK